MENKIVYSAVKPTGSPQLGNYIGALKNMVKMQEEYNCIYMIADLHALTVTNVPADLKRRIYDLSALYLALGMDPNKSIVTIQSFVPAHTELAWVLNCFTQFGEAKRMTQFKDKSKKDPENVNVGLFAYPTLMASDILLYNADYVPIGKDQKQHLELARTIAERFNNRFSPTFTVPEGIYPKQGAKIQNLLSPETKMGKTDDNANGVVFLLDDADTVMRKFKRAVTDSGNEIVARADKPGITNLLTIYSAVTNTTIAKAEETFAGYSYADFKTQVGEAVVETLRPIQEKYRDLINNKDYLTQVMREGADKAERIANRTMSKVYRKIGLVSK